MLAGIYNVNIEQGADWTLDLTWKDDAGDPIDLTGYSARMMVRSAYSGIAVLTLTSTANEIVLGGALGTIQITATADQTTAIEIDYKSLVVEQSKPAQAMVYDIELEDEDGIVVRLLQGSAFIYPEATR